MAFKEFHTWKKESILTLLCPREAVNIESTVNCCEILLDMFKAQHII